MALMECTLAAKEELLYLTHNEKNLPAAYDIAQYTDGRCRRTRTIE